VAVVNIILNSRILPKGGDAGTGHGVALATDVPQEDIEAFKI
jgi:hypothetical protein